MLSLTLLLLLAPLGQMGADDAAAEAQVLVERIQENLARIDELLLDSSDSDVPAEGIQSALEGHREVIRDLEELIRQARYSRSNQSSSGGDPNQPPPDSQQQPPPRSSDGSQSPDPSQQDSPQPSPGEQQGQQQQQQEQEGQTDGSRPEGGQPDQQPAGNERADAPPPPDALGSFTREDTDGRWGLLPPKLQERLMNLHVDDVPERYRAWLEAYIKSMNALESGGGR